MIEVMIDILAGYAIITLIILFIGVIGGPTLVDGKETTITGFFSFAIYWPIYLITFLVFGLILITKRTYTNIITISKEFMNDK